MQTLNEISIGSKFRFSRIDKYNQYSYYKASHTEIVELTNAFGYKSDGRKFTLTDSLAKEPVQVIADIWHKVQAEECAKIAKERIDWVVKNLNEENLMTANLCIKMAEEWVAQMKWHVKLQENQNS